MPLEWRILNSYQHSEMSNSSPLCSPINFLCKPNKPLLAVLIRRNQGSPLQGGNASNDNIYMCEKDVNIQTRVCNYDIYASISKDKEPLMSQQTSPLQIEKLVLDMMPRPPNDMLRRHVHNMNSYTTQKYNIVEDLSQVPYIMPTLEVLQGCHAQCKELLTTISGVDPSYTCIIKFDLDQSNPRLHHHISFQIQVYSHGTNICKCMVGKGESTSIISFMLEILGFSQVSSFSHDVEIT